MQEPDSTVNAGYGKLHTVDYLRLVYVASRILVWEIPTFSIKYLSASLFKSDSNYPTNLRLHLIRTANTFLTPRLLRSLIRTSPLTILSSPRYNTHSPTLYNPITRPLFAGTWILRAPTPTLTILHLHGGGYSTSHPATYLLFLLRLSESLLAHGLENVGIFALDYHLAPEHTYPTQLQEARAAYEYLVGEVGLSPGGIVVLGDSAGGHLALSLLVDLQLRSVEGGRIGGLVLLSPWLSLHHTPSTNEESDVISAPFLRDTARRFLGPDCDADGEEVMVAPRLEFLNPRPRTEWDVVLPEWVWVSAGTNEVMFSDIAGWTEGLEENLGRERVGFEWGVGEVHDWQWLETIDQGKQREFLGKVGECDDFEGVVAIGRAIAERVLARK